MARLPDAAALVLALVAAPLAARATAAAAPLVELAPPPARFDHPSGRARTFAAVRWKAEHPETWSRP